MHPRLLIGEFELEPAARRLRRIDGTPVHLANRPFQVLLHLVANRDRLVPRAELLEEFWDGRDVYDGALTRCLSTVRKALDDHGVATRYIETRWAEGYRYIGPCAIPGESGASGETVNAFNLGVPTQLEEEQLDSDVTIDGLLTDVKAALDEVRSQASTFGSNLSIVQNRKAFTEAMINTLETGAGNLTLADMNTEAANLLALQTRQQLSQNSLSLASQADQSILQLLQ